MKGRNVRLGNVASFIRGITFKPTDVVQANTPNSVVCMRTKNVQRDLDEHDIFALPSSFVRRPEQYLKEGDLLVSSANSWNLVGKCCWVGKLDYPATAGGFISILRGKQNELDLRYLYHWFSRPSTQNLVRNCGRQTTNISNLDLNQCLDLLLPLPPLIEQKRIAALLDEADALRRKRREAIRKLDTLVQSVFLDMFGDPFINPEGWILASLGELGSLDRGKSQHRPRNAPELYGGVYPFIQTGDVANADNYIERYQQTYSEVGLKQSKLWQRGTLCITIAANIAKTAILTFDACFPDSVVGFIPNHRTFTEYVYTWFGFMQKYLESIAPESAQKNINLEILRALSIPEPPIELQKNFVEVFRNLIALRTKMSEADEQAEVLFSNIQHEAFHSKSEPTTTEKSLPSCLTLDF